MFLFIILLILRLLLLLLHVPSSAAGSPTFLLLAYTRGFPAYYRGSGKGKPRVDARRLNLSITEM